MGEVIGAGELHKGVKLLIDGEPWEITEFDFSKPGKGQAIYNCKLRNMMTGGGMSKSYRSGDKFEKPELLQMSVTYSYDDGQAFVFTDDNFEEIRVSYDVMGDKKYFLMDEMEVKALFFNDKVIGLHLTKTDIGKEVLDIVCGAPNCREGLKVIVAQVGAKLPGGEIKAGVIRGQVSNGMLCSLKELGIDENLLPEDSPSHNGIEELDDRFEVGDTDILEKLGYDDTILDVSIYANRPDCLSMFAMAKEMGAILNREVRLPEFAGKADVGKKTDFRLDSRSANCPHFLAKVVNKVTIKESPEWLKQHLKANGVKCINNLVDISNYVMLETGQPLHFYDLRSIPAKEITVVDDYEGNYTALDGIEYKIEKGDLMITSEGKPIGIAGIMGGDNTKILDDTTGLIIEAALFDHAQIRRTSNRLGLQTEAAARFAKGLEPLAQNKAMDRAVQLLLE